MQGEKQHTGLPGRCGGGERRRSYGPSTAATADPATALSGSVAHQASVGALNDAPGVGQVQGDGIHGPVQLRGEAISLRVTVLHCGQNSEGVGG